MTSILIAAAHPDDDILGCGGTALWHAEAGDTVHVLFLADGETSRVAGAAARIGQRRDVARSACRLLRMQEPRFESFPDNAMDTVPLLDVAKAVERVIADVSPRIVYTHHGGDLNVDHRITFQAVMTACRPQPHCTVRTILSFEVPSSTDWAGAAGSTFIPSRFVDISRQLPSKLHALECYRDEMRPFPHVRSFEAVSALAQWRGASAGMAAAEAFLIVRDLVTEGGS